MKTNAPAKSMQGLVHGIRLLSRARIVAFFFFSNLLLHLLTPHFTLKKEESLDITFFLFTMGPD
jgi:hypothetical protein